MRVFLSYGHDDYAALALRIKRDLETLGHEVWFDVERLKISGDWERYIEEGFEFASRDKDAGRFLLLMTPHSVRRPDGYCLNELARAYGRNLPIIPVMVSDIEPPLSICRLQWLDMRQSFPAEKHEEQYAKQFGQLVKALTEKRVPFEGVQQRLLNYLEPITYADDLSRHLSRFIGREWVMSEVEEWLAGPRRVMWITAETGVGKSAVAAWLCDKRSEVAAYHFCRFGNADRVDARKALFSLAYQLSTQLPVYQDRLNSSALEKTVVETNLPAVFDRLFVNLLTDAVPLTDKSHVLLVDALDEATRNGRNELASLIGGEFDRLPSWIRVIVTSRPHEQEINSDLQALDPWKLDAGRAENLLDIRKYLYRELRPFTPKGVPSDEVVGKIVDKSEGLFLYVNWVRQELQERRLTLAQVEDFPRGLGGVYKDSFKRYFPDVSEYKSHWRPALEAICAAREPLRLEDLASVLGRSEYEMRELTAHLGSLFPTVEGRVRTFHQSVRDWLTDPVRSGPYWIDVSAQERRLADLAWREFKAGVNTMGRYCINYAPSHLAVCQKKTELKGLMLAPDWVEAKLQIAGVVPLLADYDLALGVLVSEANDNVTDDAETSAVRLVQGAIRLSSNVIAKDPGQFTSQMVGRLLSYEHMPAIAEFTKRVAKGTRTLWLRSLRATLHPPGTALVRTLKGHAGDVGGVALTGDGRVAVSASSDQTLKVWEVDSGRELRTLEGHFGEVRGVALTGDGRLAVSASSDRTLKVWDVHSGRELRTLKGHADPVNGAALSEDGRLAVSASSDKTLKVWEVESGRELSTLKGHSGYVWGVALTGDGRLAVSASSDRTLRVWDVASGHELRTLEGHTGWVNGVVVSGDGRLAVSASGDKTLKVWEVANGKELCTLKGHSSDVHCAAVSENGRLVVSASEDRTLKVWEVAKARAARTLAGHSYAAKSVAISRDGRLGVSASSDGTLNVWELESARAAPVVPGHSYVVNGVAMSRDGRLAVSASSDGTLKVWETATGSELRTLERHRHFVTGVAVSEDGQIAVSASKDDTLKVWDVTNGCELRTLTGHTRAVHGVGLSRDGQIAVSASADCDLKVWQVASGRALNTLLGHRDWVRAVAVSEDGRLAVSASDDKTLKVWDLRTGRQLRTLTGHSGEVYGVALTSEGKHAVSASGDKTLKVWVLESGRVLRTLQGHRHGVGGVALSGDGRLAVSASFDHTLKVWELDTGGVLATFTCDSRAYCCAFSDALNRFVAGDAGGHVHFLRLEEPKPKN